MMLEGAGEGEGEARGWAGTGRAGTWVDGGVECLGVSASLRTELRATPRGFGAQAGSGFAACAGGRRRCDAVGTGRVRVAGGCGRQSTGRLSWACALRAAAAEPSSLVTPAGPARPRHTRTGRPSRRHGRDVAIHTAGAQLRSGLSFPAGSPVGHVDQPDARTRLHEQSQCPGSTHGAWHARPTSSRILTAQEVSAPKSAPP
jgi:hypothetical protein